MQLQIARAFSLFLQLANLAEQYHRVRRRRHYRANNATPQVASFEHTITELLGEGVSQEDIIKELANVNVDLCFTAHPTEVTRPTVLEKYSAITDILEDLDQNGGNSVIYSKLKQEILLCWKTAEIRPTKPSPIDEAKRGYYFLEKTIWNSLPGFYKHLDLQSKRLLNKPLDLDFQPIKFSSWMGGDRDGNPNVTSTTTLEVHLRGRLYANRLYIKDLEELYMQLSISDASDALKEAAGGDFEPYRAVFKKLLKKVRADQKTVQVYLDEIKKFTPTKRLKFLLNKQEFLATLQLCYDSLKSVGLDELADSELKNLIIRVHTFGETFLKLDIRQESSVHRRAMDYIYSKAHDSNFNEMSEEAKCQYLLGALASDKSEVSLQELLKNNDERTAETTELFRTLNGLTVIGPEYFHGYVISMTEKLSDILIVEYLLKITGIPFGLDVIPLFETIQDLENAPKVLNHAFKEKAYCSSRKNKFEIMLGYSDSAKDGGRISAAWNLYEAQENILAVAKKHGVDIVFFHGRGGSIGRGGGPTYLALESQAPESLAAGLRVTEQGEVLQKKFAIPELAERNFEIYYSSILRAKLLKPAEVPAEWRKCMKELAASSFDEYQRMVFQNEEFIPYFNQVTPVQYLGDLNIGSRPSKRKDGAEIKHLRAIPWIFAWTQTRLLLPSWLGVGYALKYAIDQKQLDLLQEMYAKWPFFRSTMSLVAMVLAKSDLHMFSHYQNLLGGSQYQALFDELCAKNKLSIEMLCKVSGESELLEKTNPVLKRSIAVRNPYVDPINILQAEILSEIRKGNEQPDVMHALLVTIHGIANGMRNTG